MNRSPRLLAAAPKQTCSAFGSRPRHYRGKMREAERLTDDLFQRLQSAKRLGFAGEGFVRLATSQAAVGRRDTALAGLKRVQTHDMLTSGGSDEVVAFAAVLGDAKLSKAYMNQAMEHIRKVSAPEKLDNNERVLRALDALAAHRYEEAYQLAIQAGNDVGDNNSAFVAGIAALRLKQWDQAIAAFNTMIAGRTKLGLSPLIAICHIMLGRAHASAGHVSEARNAYQEAFTIWKDADADLPLLVEARQEFARLGT